MILVLASIKYFQGQASRTFKAFPHLQTYPSSLSASNSPLMHNSIILLDMRMEGKIGQIGWFPSTPALNFLPSQPPHPPLFALEVQKQVLVFQAA